MELKEMLQKQQIRGSCVAGDLRGVATHDEYLFLVFNDGRWAVFSAAPVTLATEIFLLESPFDFVEEGCAAIFEPLGLLSPQETAALYRQREEERDRRANDEERARYERLKAKFEPAPEAEEERRTWPEWGRIFQDERSITIMSEPWGQAPDEPITREAAERLLLTCSQMPRPRLVAAEAEEEGDA